MPRPAASWWFEEDEAERIEEALRTFLHDSNARCVLLIDRLGQLITTAGDFPDFDSAAFASLAAADFSANAQLASMIGSPGFSCLFHQGARESLFLADVADRVIMVVLFDDRATLGMIRLRVRKAIDVLGEIFSKAASQMAVSPGGAPFQKTWAAAAESEIDRLFGAR